MGWGPTGKRVVGESRAALVVVQALWLGACGGTGAGDDAATEGADDAASTAGGRLPDGGASFELLAAFTYESPEWSCRSWVPPATERFPVRLTPTAGGTVRMIVVGGGRWLAPFELSPDATDPYLLHGTEVVLGGAVVEEPVCEYTGPYWLDTLDLRLIDGDGDGIADALDGVATGRIEHQTYDLTCTWQLTADIEGIADRHRPTIRVACGAHAVVHPFDDFCFDADEALPTDLTATLLIDGAAAGPLAVVPDPGSTVPEAYSVYAPTYEQWPLPFGVEVGISFSPELRDLAGNIDSSAPRALLRTPPDPGFLVEDGFEGPVAAYLDGAAQVVDGFGGLPAISGARSLLLTPNTAGWAIGGSRFTARLRLDPGDRRIVFRYRLLYVTADGDTMLGDFSAVALPMRHQMIRFSLPDAPPTGEFEPTGATPWDQVSAIAEWAVDLPADPGTEAWVDIYLADAPCGPLALGPDTALLLDDLRAE